MKKEFRVWIKSIRAYQKQYYNSEAIGLHYVGVLNNLTRNPNIEESDCVFEQWTGCYDKNGTPIYEGDILANDLIIPHDNDNIGVVYFAAGSYMIDGDGPFYDHVYGHSPDILDNHTVIGNKYENPELLKA